MIWTRFARYYSNLDLISVAELYSQEPTMTTSRLELLSESLAAGADIYAPSNDTVANDVNEMEVILDGR